MSRTGVRVRCALRSGRALACRRSTTASCRCRGRASRGWREAILRQRTSRSGSYCPRADPRHRPSARPCEGRTRGAPHSRGRFALRLAVFGPGHDRRISSDRFPACSASRTPPEGAPREQGRKRFCIYSYKCQGFFSGQIRPDFDPRRARSRRAGGDRALRLLVILIVLAAEQGRRQVHRRVHRRIAGRMIRSHLARVDSTASHPCQRVADCLA